MLNLFSYDPGYVVYPLEEDDVSVYQYQVVYWIVDEGPYLGGIQNSLIMVLRVPESLRI